LRFKVQIADHDLLSVVMPNKNAKIDFLDSIFGFFLPKNRLKERFQAKCNQTVILFDLHLDKLYVEVKNLTYHNVNYGAHRVRRSYAKI